MYGPLHQMAHICERYAKKFDVLFKTKKNQVIIYSVYKVKPPDWCVTVNSIKVKCADQVIYLGYLLTENVYELNMSKCFDDFNCHCYMFLADCTYCGAHVRNVLFQKILYQLL